jgi:hypothetical protein
MPHTWHFICAVAGHWVSLMTGGIIALALVLYERISGAEVLLSIYWAIAAFTVFAATFLAWRDEYLGRERAEKQIKDREKRRTIRVELAKLMSEGQELERGYDKQQRPTGEEVNQWADRVEQYLRAALDEAFVVRFRDQSFDDGLMLSGISGFESRRWTFVRCRVANLGKFIQELQ